MPALLWKTHVRASLAPPGQEATSKTAIIRTYTELTKNGEKEKERWGQRVERRREVAEGVDEGDWGDACVRKEVGCV